MTASDFPRPYPVQFTGSAAARWLLRRAGWQVDFDGLPALQGVLAIYPHTSNWDFVVLILVKWAMGVPVRFWAKDSLFRVPLFGRWLRRLGGVPVDRSAPNGLVGATVAQLAAARRAQAYFWLAVAPEGTRRLRAGWRSGFYRTAVQAGVPLGLVRLDYASRQVGVRDFFRPGGDEAADFERMRAGFAGVRGRRPGHAAPIQLLEPTGPRSDNVVK